MSHKPMSIEAVMDEERREVLALLGKRSDQNRRSSSVASAQRSVTSRSGSPFTPGVRSPMRSMLDFGDDGPETPPPTTRAANRGSPRVQAKSIRSMLDVDSSPTLPPIKHVFSAQNSPTEANHRMQLGGSFSTHPRSMSDVSSQPANFGPRSSHTRGVNPSADYQFSDIITNRDTPAFTPRRAKQKAGANSAAAAAKRNSSVAEIIRNADLSGLMLPGGQNPLHGRPQASTRGSTAKSKSPHGRLNARSKSPGAALSARTLSPAGRALLAETQLDMQNAYRRLSDANLIRSGGSLSELPRRKHSDGNDVGNGRLTKDYLSPDGDELADTSDEDEAYSSEDDESGRGRKTARSFPDELPRSASAAGKDGRQPLSLLAAAEEERIQVSQNYQYRSLFDEPEITVTNPSGEKVKTAKAGVHPANSFDVPSRSASRTPWDSDDEAEYTDIKSAQKLAFTMTPIMSTPDVPRSVRIIYRGDFVKIQKEVTEEEHRRLRKYLVATDLSEESTHALEWAVGTVVRDGDTLVAIYCVDEETGIPPADGPEGPKSAREQAASSSTPSVPSKLSGMTSLSTLATMAGSSAGLSGGTPMSSRPSLLTKSSDSSTTISSPVERTKAEEERERAVQDITNRITRLLRKTRLQVRVIVEVLHCKTPRHTLTEVIDILSPTLVILGSRGRSALKGVILGSFSNYLVTKSSAPVMVARKRLRKQSLYRRPPVNQVNNLNNPTARSLANAKID